MITRKQSSKAFTGVHKQGLKTFTDSLHDKYLNNLLRCKFTENTVGSPWELMLIELIKLTLHIFRYVVKNFLNKWIYNLICTTTSRSVTSPPHFHAWEKEMATHSSVLAWRIPGMGEPGGVYGVAQSRTRLKWLSSRIWLSKH